MGFVGNYAPCGLSPQTDGMPVILKKDSIAYRHAVLQKLKLLLCTHKAFFKHALADGNYFITSVYNGLFQ